MCSVIAIGMIKEGVLVLTSVRGTETVKDNPLQ